MDLYIARLEKFLGSRHKSTKGFTIIRDLIERGEAPLMGVFYSGKEFVEHDLVLYSIGESLAEFKPVSFKPGEGSRRNLLQCIEKAAEIAGTIQNPPSRTDHLVILAMDQAALDNLHDLQAKLNENGNTINGCRVTYVAMPLEEHSTHYEESPTVEDAYHGPEEPLSLQAEALRQGMLARYEKKAPAKPANPDAPIRHVSAP
ncbi:hypothetical protein KY338_03545 [Candidatus Woesearchaeota archaeon]|nr:hypothetical protein [Candidatus Woesearchaeota archaeon]MBW3005322.1 hypothetical protein [Candidatus Woesearchaeota archaeon]